MAGMVKSVGGGAAGSEGATFTGNKTINGQLGVNRTATVRQPITIGGDLNASALTGTNDKIGIAASATASGNFGVAPASSGTNPGFFWGLNLFAATGSNAGDGAGITSFNGALIESSICTPAGTTFPYVVGLQAEAAFYGPTAGATVTQMESMRVSAPKRKDGATAGTANTVYCLFIESPDAYNVGATNGSFALFVEGGVTRLQGRIDCAGILLGYNSSLSLQGDYSGAGKINLTTNGIGFFGATPAARPTSVPITAAGVHAALVTLGLIT